MEKEPYVTEWALEGGSANREDEAALDLRIQLFPPEPDVPADLDRRDPPFTPQPADLALARSQIRCRPLAVK